MSQYVLPQLPYDFGALEPHISARVMELHLPGGFEQFYVDMTAVASDDSLDQHARTEQMKAARGPSVHTHGCGSSTGMTFRSFGDVSAGHAARSQVCW